MKRMFKFLALTACLLISTVTFASPTTHGVYVEATGGFVYINENLIGDFTESGGFGWNTNLGFQFMKWLALDGGFSMYDMAGASNAYSAHIAAKAILAFTDRFNIFIKLGPGVMFSSESGVDSAGGLFYALGVSLALSKQLDLTVQTSGVTQLVDTVGLVSGGLTYHFA